MQGDTEIEEEARARYRQERFDQLLVECRAGVIEQIMIPFGLSPAMFTDRNGGNVTTVHNFERIDSDYIADKDQATFARSRVRYDRGKFKSCTEDQRDRVVQSQGHVDAYTGKPLVSGEGGSQQFDVDHVRSLKSFHEDKRAHLALDTGRTKHDALSKLANNDANLAAVSPSANRSKGGKDAKAWMASHGEKHGAVEQLVADAVKRSDNTINRTINRSLLKKQGNELLHTGAAQAGSMALKQALGMLTVEVVNGLFVEIKDIVCNGIAVSKTFLEDFGDRLVGLGQRLVAKLPDLVGAAFQGGISGFISNLLTFIINSFVSTAASMVRVIRDGLIKLYQAFKMLFFPPKHMTKQQALCEGLKILTTVIVTSLGVLLEKSIQGFLLSVPFLTPFAEILTGILIGTLSGLLSAFLAYQLDLLFNKLANAHDEKMLDAYIADGRNREAIVAGLAEQVALSMAIVRSGALSIEVYDAICESADRVEAMASAMSESLDGMVAETASLVLELRDETARANAVHAQIAEFLDREP